MDRVPSHGATVLAAVGALATTVTPARAHVDYVTGEPGSTIDPIAFLVETVSSPTNLLLLGGGAAAVVVALGAYFLVRPRVTDVVVLRETLAGYDDLIPWMLRLSLGLPLVGAGFVGYLFSPAVPFDRIARPDLRLLLIGLGFLLLFGLATRIVSAAGLGTYLLALVSNPGAVLAIEFLPGFLVLLVLGGGRPSADHMLQRVASTEGTLYGRVDPVHHLKEYLDRKTRPYRRFVPTILRVGMGVAFIYLGLTQKLGAPAQSLAVVEKYGLTGVVPVDPEMWVVGAGLTEMAVGTALIAGFLTRLNAAVAFTLFTLTLFGLPDDPVLAHISLFGMASAVFIMGAGPLSVDEWAGRPAVFESESVVPGS
jgi:uncharacterized membrane protein YphA (DoxX/SURF4 family)